MLGLMLAGLALALERRPAAGAVADRPGRPGQGAGRAGPAVHRADLGRAAPARAPAVLALADRRGRLVRRRRRHHRRHHHRRRHRVRLDRRAGHADAGPHLDVGHDRRRLLGRPARRRARPGHVGPGAGLGPAARPGRRRPDLPRDCCAATTRPGRWSASASAWPRCSRSARSCTRGTCCGRSCRWRPRRPSPKIRRGVLIATVAMTMTVLPGGVAAHGGRVPRRRCSARPSSSASPGRWTGWTGATRRGRCWRACARWYAGSGPTGSRRTR